MDRESPSLTSYKTSFHMIEEPTDRLEKRKAINQVSGRRNLPDAAQGVGN